jgi:hypothetical protein
MTRTRTSRVGLVLMLVAMLVLTVLVAQRSEATGKGHDKPWICHPANGNGETGTGWNLIDPSHASSHINEATGAGKHTTKDGRTDVYAQGKTCPTVPGDPEPVVVVPNPPVKKDLCGTNDDHYGLPSGPAEASYVRVERDIEAELHGNYAWGPMPAGWTKVDETTAAYRFSPGDFTDVPCETPEPEPSETPTAPPTEAVEPSPTPTPTVPESPSAPPTTTPPPVTPPGDEPPTEVRTLHRYTCTAKWSVTQEKRDGKWVTTHRSPKEPIDGNCTKAPEGPRFDETGM